MSQHTIDLPHKLGGAVPEFRQTSEVAPTVLLSRPGARVSAREGGTPPCVARWARASSAPLEVRWSVPSWRAGAERPQRQTDCWRVAGAWSGADLGLACAGSTSWNGATNVRKGRSELAGRFGPAKPPAMPWFGTPQPGRWPFVLRRRPSSLWAGDAAGASSGWHQIHPERLAEWAAEDARGGEPLQHKLERLMRERPHPAAKLRVKQLEEQERPEGLVAYTFPYAPGVVVPEGGRLVAGQNGLVCKFAADQARVAELHEANPSVAIGPMEEGWMPRHAVAPTREDDDRVVDRQAFEQDGETQPSKQQQQQEANRARRAVNSYQAASVLHSIGHSLRHDGATVEEHEDAGLFVPATNVGTVGSIRPAGISDTLLLAHAQWLEQDGADPV